MKHEGVSYIKAERIRVPKEKFDLSELAEDEIEVIQGINYEDLPEQFVISSRTMNACSLVWEHFKKSNPTKKLQELREKIRRYLEDKMDENSRIQKQQQFSHAYLNEEIFREFGMQFYLIDGQVQNGDLYKGVGRGIYLRNHRDSISDSNSVVHIHNHPTDIIFSAGDIVGVVTNQENIPQSCLYFVVTAEYLFLLFPTNDTTFVEKSVAEEIKKLEMELVKQNLSSEERAKKQKDIIVSISREYKLGLYLSEKSSVMSRIK